MSVHKNNIYWMKLERYFEYIKHGFEPLNSFKMKKELNPKVWDDFHIKDEIRSKLLIIAQDFYNSTSIDAEIKDIVLTGSLANYNWSNKYSDFDLHILIDFSEVNNDIELVSKLAKSVKSMWNLQHDITISGYKVEVYIQDTKEKHISSGVFSLLENKWLIKPVKNDTNIDVKLIEIKAEPIMYSIDNLEKIIDRIDYEDFNKRLNIEWEKIKKFRKSGLENEGGELSTGNLVFKLLRRNGYIDKIINMKRESYDKQFN